jgi:hypothetical protein
VDGYLAAQYSLPCLGVFLAVLDKKLLFINVGQILQKKQLNPTTNAAPADSIQINLGV